jgi:hypothetical protein
MLMMIIAIQNLSIGAFCDFKKGFPMKTSFALVSAATLLLIQMPALTGSMRHK